MSKRAAAVVLAFLVLAFSRAAAQQTPWYQWTFLPPVIMDEIIGEASGETAWNTTAAATPFERDRLAAEYRGTFREAQYVLDQLQLYGIPGAAIERFPGGQTWDGVKGELWEVNPRRQKLASYQDLRAMLASGSANADVIAPLVWVGMGTQAELERAGVSGADA